MNFFDVAVLEFVNELSHVSRLLDKTVLFIANNHLLKGGVLLVILWSLWFKAQKNQLCVRAYLVSTFFACFISMMFARALVVLLPFRPRPIHEGSLDFMLPFGMNPRALKTWSSFPSDHATLFFALSLGILCVSRRFGIVALAYTFFFIALPRVYLGLHYPTDILAGAMLAGSLVFLCHRSIFIERVSRPIVDWSEKKPEWFYPLFFLASYQIVDLFNSSRAVVRFASKIWDML